MAASVPETDSGFPRRTALQPALTNSPAAGSEAPVTADASAKRPDPFAKAAPRPTAPAKPAAAPAPTASAKDQTAEAALETPAAPTAADWGLASKPRRSAMKFKIAGAIGLLLSAGGGYFGYQKYFPKGADSAETEQEIADADDESHKPHSKAKPTADDPFGDSLNMGGDDDLESLPAREPRKVGHQPQAEPISRRHATAAAGKKTPHRKAPTTDDDPFQFTDEDESTPPKFAQTEPELEDEDLSGSSLQSPAKKHRTMGTAAQHGKSVATSPKSGHHAQTGPRIHSLAERDGDLPADITDDFAADKLDGYELSDRARAGRTPSRKTTGHSQGPKISVIDVRDEDAPDERLEGFTADDATTRRAVSKTRIVRSTDDDAFDERTTASEIEDDFGVGRSSRNGPAAIHRRGADGHSRADRLPADRFSDSDEHAGATYRVQPDDNFWKISRKQYGSARYYQALTQHNLDRAPDPQKLRPGTQISTPTAAYLERKYPNLIEKGSADSATHHAGAHPSRTRPRFEKPGTEHDFDRPAERSVAKETGEGYFYSKSGDPMYRIGADDTLTGIAQKHLGRASRWTEIYEQNQDILSSPDNLTLGTVIRLPGDASRLSLVPENDRRR
ncbi:MAG: LysM peptidoglycan-binding domain-containing protein [Planctomycetia bacterium]|nr:LysM peptidoglycan-binding domain-containing protein [Planctomycetia bacterium]